MFEFAKVSFQSTDKLRLPPMDSLYQGIICFCLPKPRLPWEQKNYQFLHIIVHVLLCMDIRDMSRIPGQEGPMCT